MLDSILSRVDPRTGHALGTFFESLGRILLSNAALAEEQTAVNERRRRRQAEIREAADAIEEMIGGGVGLEAAIAQVALRLQADPDQLRESYRLAQRRNARRRLLARNIRIMQLAGQGLPPRKIALQVGISADRVGRVIREMIAAGHDIESLRRRYRHLRANHPPAANSDAPAPVAPQPVAPQPAALAPMAAPPPAAEPWARAG